MARYMLDTHMCSYIMKRSSQAVLMQVPIGCSRTHSCGDV
jgi:hypothetical protein